jgi:hypothetical protein
MSNPKSFMEPIWEQDKDAGYDFSDEAFAADNAYYYKYGGNACIVCMGGSYVNNINIKTADNKKNTYSTYSTYDENDIGDNIDDDYYEDEEDYIDNTNDY